MMVGTLHAMSLLSFWECPTGGGKGGFKGLVENVEINLFKSPDHFLLLSAIVFIFVSYYVTTL
jgi:hypothetical protein